MKKLLVLLLVCGSAMADQTPPSVVSVMNGAIDVGTFVSAAPNQSITQTSIGSLTGSTTVTGVPVITSTIVGFASSSSSGTGAVYPSFTVNSLPSSAVVQGAIRTTITNYDLPISTIGPVHHDNHDD